MSAEKHHQPIGWKNSGWHQPKTSSTDVGKKYSRQHRQNNSPNQCWLKNPLANVGWETSSTGISRKSLAGICRKKCINWCWTKIASANISQKFAFDQPWPRLFSKECFKIWKSNKVFNPYPNNWIGFKIQKTRFGYKTNPLKWIKSGLDMVGYGLVLTNRIFLTPLIGGVYKCRLCLINCW